MWDRQALTKLFSALKVILRRHTGPEIKIKATCLSSDVVYSRHVDRRGGTASLTLQQLLDDIPVDESV